MTTFPGDSIPTLRECAFGETDLRHLERVLHKANGLVICSGPAGSGKTTTLYACLKHLSDDPHRKTIAIERPLYGDLPAVIRIPWHDDPELGLPVLLRSAMRSMPDALMVPALDDPVVVRLALRAALTRQLVLSQLDAASSAEALLSILQRNPLPFHITEYVRLVVNQRLVRRLCSECSQEVEPTPEEAAFVHAAGELHGLSSEALPSRFHAPVGCVACDRTGYRGRCMIAELLPMSPELREGIEAGMPGSRLRRIAYSQGLSHLALDGIRKAARGLTTLAEVRESVQGDPFV